MTAQEVIKAFMAKLVSNKGASSGEDMLDAAIYASSRFDGINAAIAQFKSDRLQAERDAIKEVLTAAGKWDSSYEGKQLSELETTVNGLGIDATTLDSNANFNDSNLNATSVANVIREKAAEKFLSDYCGIELNAPYWINSAGSATHFDGFTTDNTDTGAITGSDAGGSITKTATSVVPPPPEAIAASV